MYSVYLLESIEVPKKTYVGLTIKPLHIRLKEHNEGKSQYTKAHLPWQVIYYETYHCKVCAEAREKFLKSGVGFRFRKIILENYQKLK